MCICTVMHKRFAAVECFVDRFKNSDCCTLSVNGSPHQTPWFSWFQDIPSPSASKKWRCKTWSQRERDESWAIPPWSIKTSIFGPETSPLKYWCRKRCEGHGSYLVKTTCASFRQHDVHVILRNPFCSVFAVWRGKHNFWWPSTAFFFRGRRSVWLTYRSIFHGGHKCLVNP